MKGFLSTLAYHFHQDDENARQNGDRKTETKSGDFGNRDFENRAFPSCKPPKMKMPCIFSWKSPGFTGQNGCAGGFSRGAL